MFATRIHNFIDCFFYKNSKSIWKHYIHTFGKNPGSSLCARWVYELLIQPLFNWENVDLIWQMKTIFKVNASLKQYNKNNNKIKEKLVLWKEITIILKMQKLQINKCVRSLINLYSDSIWSVNNCTK